MGALITQPKPFTVLSAPALATAPATNLGLDHPGRVWKSTAASTSVVLELQGDGSPIDTVALIGSDLTAFETIEVRTAATQAALGSAPAIVPSVNRLNAGQAFANTSYWSVSGVTVGLNPAIPDPLGSYNGWLLVETATTNNHEIYQSLSNMTLGQTYTFSTYLKAGNATWGKLMVWNGTGYTYAWFNLAAGTVGSVSKVSGDLGYQAHRMEPVGDGWFRCSIVWTYTQGSGGGHVRIGTSTADGVIGFAGAPPSSIWIFGPQLELGNIATPLAITGTLSYQVPGFVGVKPASSTAITIIKVPPVSGASERFNFVRVTLTLASARTVTAQRLVIGQSIGTDGIDYDCEQSFEDTSLAIDGQSYSAFEDYPILTAWKFKVSKITNRDWRAKWAPMLSTVGRSKAVLFVPDDIAQAQADMIFGRINTSASGQASGWDYWVASLGITALAP